MSTRKPVVVVTGASKGIGLAVTSILLNKFHVRVIALSRSSPPDLRRLACDDLVSLECDITDESAVRDALCKLERIDALILNVGTIDPLGQISDESIPLSSWKSHFDVNFFSLIPCIQACLPALRTSDKGGRIVFVSSGAAVKGTPGWGPYNASKAAMNSLCRTLGEEEAQVTSIAVRPGMVDTGMQLSLREKGALHMSPEDYRKFVQVHAEGQLLPPDLPGHVIAALSLQAPKALSGQFVNWNDEACKEFQL